MNMHGHTNLERLALFACSSVKMNSNKTGQVCVGPDFLANIFLSSPWRLKLWTIDHNNLSTCRNALCVGVYRKEPKALQRVRTHFPPQV
jgi:hypothetical protein